MAAQNRRRKGLAAASKGKAAGRVVPVRKAAAKEPVKPVVTKPAKQTLPVRGRTSAQSKARAGEMNPLMGITLPPRRVSKPEVAEAGHGEWGVPWRGGMPDWRRSLPRWRGKVDVRRGAGNEDDAGLAGGVMQGWANLRRGVRGNLMPWRDRFWSWMGRGEPVSLPESGEISRESMASLQAAVMQELAQLQEQRHEPRAGSRTAERGQERVAAGELIRTKPFQGMPVAGGMGMPAPETAIRRAPAGARPLVWLGAAVVLAAGLALAVRQMQQVDGPVEALESVRHSMQTADVAGFERHVDVAAVAQSAAEQLGARVQPSLAAALQTEILTGVSNGQARAASGVLQQLLGDAGAAEVRLGRARLVPPEAGLAPQPDTAVVEVMLERRGEAAVPLQVALQRVDGVWQVTALPNLSGTLGQLAIAPAAGGMSETVMQERVKPMAKRGLVSATAADLKAVRVQVLEKTVTDDGQLLVQGRVGNTGKLALQNLRVQLVFADAAGQPMKVAVVTLPGVLAGGERRSKGWLVPLDSGRRLDRHVRDLPLAAMTVRAEVLSGQR